MCHVSLGGGGQCSSFRTNVCNLHTHAHVANIMNYNVVCTHINREFPSFGVHRVLYKQLMFDHLYLCNQAG